MNINVSQLTTTPTHYEENHATIHLNERNRVIIQMDSGWVFYDEYDYTVDGVYVEPAPEDFFYSRRGSFGQDWNFAGIIPVDETTVPDPENQIFGSGNNAETVRK